MASTHIVVHELFMGMSILQKSADYSDLVITCGEEVLNVHRAIDAMTGKVELKDEDAVLVQHLVDHLYTLDYDYGLGAIRRLPDGEKVSAFWLEHYACKLAINIHELADKYGVQGLSELATVKLEEIMLNLEFGPWKADDFVAIVDQVYEKTCLVDRMREVIVAQAVRDLDKLIGPSFHELIAKEPGFSMDVHTGCSRLVNRTES